MLFLGVHSNNYALLKNKILEKMTPLLHQASVARVIKILKMQTSITSQLTKI